ncbi:hypothetical protein KC19_4G030700 [Ceratodon purpureus]|uniref:Uncharacterized protein n=1 Tax=Ceratodon purpureus TaxID=3225 RepID=A0A8T0I4W5_CERPU|nr:hypothetical protein KC19_4G030700 [Ceratodon purpureus]
MSARRYHVDFGVNARNPCSVGTIVLNRSIVKSEFRHLWHLRLHIQKDLRRKAEFRPSQKLGFGGTERQHGPE